MSDRERLLEETRRQSRIEWDVDRSRAAHQGALVRRRRRRAGRALVGASLVCATVAVVAVRTWRPPAPPIPSTAARTIELPDGSGATLYGSATLRVRERGPEDRLLVEVPHGRVRFTVRSAARRFRVVAGPVEVIVLGTIFDVNRRPDGVRVEVERGRVEVRWPGGARTLGAAEGAHFPPREPLEDRTTKREPAVPDAAGPEARQATTHEAPARAPRGPAPRGASEWRRLANRRQYAQAFAALDGGAVRDEPGDLLLAADVARLSGHPREAGRHLERLLDRFPADPRVPTAAFTLGKLRVEALGAPREAAAAFARARAADRDGLLAPLALAREAEAWWRCGERALARARVEAYRRLYPGGAHLSRLEALVAPE